MKRRYIWGVGLAVLVVLAVALLRSAEPETKQAVSKTGYYVALGDSVAAGIGLEGYSDASACDRTNQSYAAIIANKLQYDLKNVACSGASTTIGLLGIQEVNKLAVPPQIETLLANQKPSLITLTIGANDADWTTLIQKCYTTTCGSDADTIAVDEALLQVSNALDTSFTQIQAVYPKNLPVVAVTGYYRLFGTTMNAGCVELKGIEPSEIAWIEQLQAKIDTAISTQVEKYSYVTYVPLNFAGHELCTDDSWIQGLAAAKPYHPTYPGQKAIAGQIITKTGLDR